ncbi:MAG TPA: hypothetical protein PK674_00175 [Candidatus Absconditabacterales bacterium]|nr:hypothetical protein [Candidatus Absconditabacterales bacterium]HOQ79047.1 hypothetical protein [Candidatus Absconditabacterales bacterium]HPK28196.1 hypothetical protein [Candidatus Absconditabacterales bacterium]
MVNEIFSPGEGIDAGESVRQDISKVTEQDIKRVQGDSAKAKQVQDEIKKTKATNNNIAKFLSFLLKNIKNEELISAIYDTFFKVVDTRTQTIYLRKSINNIVVIGFFAPFFLNEINKFGLNIYFTELLNDKSGNSMVEYIAYIKKLSKKYHDNVPINKDVLLNLLALIMGEFGISKETLSGPGKDKVKKEIEKKLK